MIRIHLGSEDLGRLRFGISPLAELVMGLRLALDHRPDPHHARWVREARDALTHTDLTLFCALVRPVGYFPDFLTPPPVAGLPSFEEQLGHLAETPPEQVRDEVFRVRRESPGHHPEVLAAFMARPAEMLARLCEVLHRCWDLVLATHWRQVRTLLEADVSPHATRLAMGHPGAVLDGLLPDVHYRPGVLELSSTACALGDQVLDLHLKGRGLLLVPEVFCAGGYSLVFGDFSQPTLWYQPRGVAALWGHPPLALDRALAAALGTQRAQVLLALARPVTTEQVARTLDITSNTVSYHLGRLRGAGLVEAERRGRLVVYRLSTRGEALLEVFG